MDPSQFGNQKHLSTQHYLIRLLHRVLTATDNNSRGEINAVFCLMIDWRQAFSRQCHSLGVESFIRNGVRPALIPLLISYFQDRRMHVRWHGKTSNVRNLPGSGAMGSSLGIWEFLSQTNNNADCVPIENRFKFVDDLTTLEIVNLINIGISSYNMKTHIPSDIPVHGQYVNCQNLQSQKYLNEINNWTKNQKNENIRR